MKTATFLPLLPSRSVARPATWALLVVLSCGVAPYVEAQPAKKGQPAASAPAKETEKETSSSSKWRPRLRDDSPLKKLFNKKQEDEALSATAEPKASKTATPSAPASAAAPASRVSPAEIKPDRRLPAVADVAPPAPLTKKRKAQGAETPELTPEEIELMRGDGPLYRSDLQRLAIHAHPDFWRFRSEAAMAAAAEAAAYDIPDPELRLGYTKEFESDLRRPYTESETSTIYQSGSYLNSSLENYQDATGAQGGPLFPFGSGTRTQTEKVSEGRWIKREQVVKVKPGKYQDIREIITYETEIRKEKNKQKESSTNDVQGSRASSKSEGEETSKRRIVSRERQVINHGNDAYPDEQYEVTLRLFIPNPWEVKARAARARAERDLALDRMRMEVREIVYDVGRRYDELMFWYAWHKQNERLVEWAHASLAEVEKTFEKVKSALPQTQNTAPGENGAPPPPAGNAPEPLASNLTAPLNLDSLALSGLGNIIDFNAVPRARLEVIKAREEVFDSQRRMDEVADQLCQMCGVNDPARIVKTNILRTRWVEADKLDIPTLIEIARANRPDLHEMESRGSYSAARLKEVKALRVPWFNDVRIGWARTRADGYREQDEVAGLLTMNLPLFSWWQHKEHKQWEEGIAYYRQAGEVLGMRVEAQVEYAVRSIQQAARQLEERAKFERDSLAYLAKNEAEADAYGDNGERIRLAARELRIKMERSRLQTIYFYNQAVTLLELALGLPLEELFDTKQK